MIDINTYKAKSSKERAFYLAKLLEEADSSNEDDFIHLLQNEVDALCVWHIIKGLGVIKSTKSIEHLLNYILTHPNVSFEATSLYAVAAWSLGCIGKDAFVPLSELFNHSNPEIRQFAVDAAGEISDIRGIPYLCDALKFDLTSVALWAGLSLAKIGISARDDLVKIVKNTRNERLVIAFESLVRIDHAMSKSVYLEICSSLSVEEIASLKRCALKHKLNLDE